MNSKTTRRRGKRTLPRIVRHRVAVAVAFPVLWILDVLILAAGVSGMTWRDIRAESIDGWKRVWNNRPNDEFRGGCKPSSGTSCSALNGGGK